MSLGQQLQALETVDLIRLAHAAELTYLFRHALVRDAAYASLVRADRRRLHLAAGEALEATYTASGQTIPLEAAALFAHHFHHAAEPRAQRYAMLAGEAALAQYANAEAVSYFTLALEWASREDDPDHLLALYTVRGRALELAGDYAGAVENYQALGAAGQTHGNQRLRLHALVLEGTLRSTVNPMFDPPQGHQLAADALPLALALGDQAAEARIHWNQLNLHRFEGDNRAARVSGERSLALARAAGAAEQEAATLNDLIHVYGGLALWPEHQAAAIEAADRWRALGNQPMLADSLATAAMWAAMRGDYDRTVATSAESQRIARSINNLWGQSYSLSGLGMAHWYRGEYGEALRVTRDCLRLAEAAGYIAAFVLNGSQLSGMLLDAGQPEAALAEARAALTFAEAHLQPLRAMGVAAVALAQLALGQLDEAETLLRTAPLEEMGELLWLAGPLVRAHGELAVARQSPHALTMALDRVTLISGYQCPPLEIEALLTLAEAYELAGQHPAAHDTLIRARALAEAIQMRRLLWPTLAALAALADAAGEAAEAAHLRAEARAVVDAIAVSLPDPAMRATFGQWALAAVAGPNTAR